MKEFKNDGVDNDVVFPDEFHTASLKIKGDRNKVDLSKCPPKKVDDLEIIVEGNDCVVEIGKIRRIGRLRIMVKNSGRVFISDMTSIEEAYLLATDDTQICIGEDCMISFQVTMRTTDAHGIYSVETGQRHNYPGDVVLGDHVWIGQGALVSSNTLLEKNNIVGARSYVRNLSSDKNCIVAGVPAKKIRDGIIWDRRATDNFNHPEADVDPFFYKWLE